MTDYPEISTLIPHRSAMLLVDRLLHVEEKKGKVQATGRKNHLFLRKDGTLAPEVCCELIAQSFGACESFRRSQKGLSVEGGGYLASVRDVQVFENAHTEDELIICSEKTDECFNTYIVRGEIFCKEKKLAEGTVYIFMWQGKEPPQTV